MKNYQGNHGNAKEVRRGLREVMGCEKVMILNELSNLPTPRCTIYNLAHFLADYA